MVTVTSPPGMQTCNVPVAAPWWASAATAAATVPVPHERVSPTPRSCTRIDTEPTAGGGDHLDVDAIGKLSRIELHRSCNVERR